MVQTILSAPLFTDIVLPFLLVFVVIFAILQKTEMLGKGKKQIDALVALVMGLLVISFGYATNVITSLIPFLAVAVVVILVFMILYGMTFKAGDFKLHTGIMAAIGILAALGVIVTLLIATGAWNYVIENFLSGSDRSNIVANAVFVVLIVAAVIAVLWGGKGSKSEEKKQM